MSLIDQLSDEEKGIWHGYVCQARKLTRRSVDTLGLLESQTRLKPTETDDKLQCCARSEATFRESIASIVFSVFVAESRINLAASGRIISVSKARTVNYVDKDGAPIEGKDAKGTTFQELHHWEKWRNFPSACGLLDTKRYLSSVDKLKRWITMRNKIVHVDYEKLTGSDITPQDALDCYEAVVESMFELNILLYPDRQSEEEKSKREVSLVP